MAVRPIVARGLLRAHVRIAMGPRVVPAPVAPAFVLAGRGCTRWCLGLRLRGADRLIFCGTATCPLAIRLRVSRPRAVLRPPRPIAGLSTSASDALRSSVAATSLAASLVAPVRAALTLAVAARAPSVSTLLRRGTRPVPAARVSSAAAAAHSRRSGVVDTRAEPTRAHCLSSEAPAVFHRLAQRHTRRTGTSRVAAFCRPAATASRRRTASTRGVTAGHLPQVLC